MNRVRTCLLALVALAALVAAASPARAGHICELLEPGLVEADGDLDEWRDLGKLERGHGDAGASYQMRCGYDGKRLHVLVKVKDDRVYRTGKAGGESDDNLVLTLVAADGRAPWSLRFWPGTRGFKAKKDGGRGVQAVDTLLEDGWALEASVPLSSIPGWGPSTPLVRGEVTYRDVDAPGGVAATLRFRGSMHFSAAVPALRGFLVAARLGVPGLRLDALADVDGLPGSERVVSGGRFVGILTDAFGFVELPVKASTDVLAVKLVDLSGTGRMSIVTHFRQHGGGGSREVVKVWTLDGSGQLASPLGFETQLTLGKRTLTNRWALVPAGERRTPEKKGQKPRRLPGQDIVVEVVDADNHGWDAASFAQVQPSPEVRPILTPWGDRRAVVYYFDGDAVMDGPALPSGER